MISAMAWPPSSHGSMASITAWTLLGSSRGRELLDVIDLAQRQSSLMSPDFSS
jgi:hypothetical protein